jgi:hypothetical protein
LYDALGKDEIDYPRFKQVQQELVDLKTPEGESLGRQRADFMRQYSEVVNPRDSMGLKHESGYARNYNLEFYARQREQELRTSGKDPHELYNPNSPDFLGKTSAARPPSAYQLQQEAAERLRNEAEARQKIERERKGLETPERPKEVPEDFTYDPVRRRWIGTRDGKPVQWSP